MPVTEVRGSIRARHSFTVSPPNGSLPSHRPARQKRAPAGLGFWESAYNAVYNLPTMLHKSPKPLSGDSLERPGVSCQGGIYGTLGLQHGKYYRDYGCAIVFFVGNREP